MNFLIALKYTVFMEHLRTSAIEPKDHKSWTEGFILS